MINEQYKKMLEGKSVIRQLSEFATGRGKEIGYENVFDYSLGNPSVPVPEKFTEVMMDLLKNKSSMELHGYSPSLGIASVKEKIAESLNKRFDMDYTGNHIFPTTGAAGALAHAVRCVTKPGDEVLTFAPYFPEYKMFIESGAGAKCVIVPPSIADFQIDFGALEQRLNEHTKAVVVNSPNNPSGAVYSEQTIKRLADMLRGKEKEYGHPIYLISDEPYREIVYDGVQVPFVPHFYDDTIICYSYSKSLSLPGERIGYVLVPPAAADSKALYAAVCGAGRALGYVCAPSMFQRVAARCADQTSDIEVYQTNRDLLFNGLTSMGYHCVKPDGAFYLFPQTLEADDRAFSERAKKYDLLVVPGADFGAPGHMRISYCVKTETIERALPLFERLAKEYR